jgi:hypothetical protein
MNAQLVTALEEKVSWKKNGPTPEQASGDDAENDRLRQNWIFIGRSMRSWARYCRLHYTIRRTWRRTGFQLVALAEFYFCRFRICLFACNLTADYGGTLDVSITFTRSAKKQETC